MQPKALTRRRHSDDLNAQVLRECSEPGASVAAIALAHGLNANLVHRWRRLASRLRAVQTQPALAPFIPLPMLAAPEPTPTPPVDIRASSCAALRQMGQVSVCRQRVRRLAAGVAAVIRVDAVWLAALRLHQGKFIWPAAGQPNTGLCRVQLDALVLGLPGQRVGQDGVIRVI